MTVRKLTLLGRSLLLVGGEISANILCWVLAAILFGHNHETRSILGLALLSWTLGLRHALDADHISAIDNATRALIAEGQMAVTCGLFFSLGHSTIVIVVNVAIAISTEVYNKIGGVGSAGAIVGPAVSGTFLFVVGLANSVILWRIIKQRRQPDAEPRPHHNHMLMMRILGPLLTFVNKPWKMYPVGVLFGFGFDTAASIALLSISALAKRRSDGSPIPSRDIVVLPLLFTAGMTLIDSMDSILMLYSYLGFPARDLALFEKDSSRNPEMVEQRTAQETLIRGKANLMSGLSIVLTLLSILVAFSYVSVTIMTESTDFSSISLITIMGLIGENCKSCRKAADAEDGGGLSGSWWRAWSKANDNSGYIGAAIVGCFAIVVTTWYGIRRWRPTTRRSSAQVSSA
ncbi:NicO-domain-containing protein [Mycena floridula]|nr:NicO-domain-containing protein [Mycena floridula]